MGLPFIEPQRKTVTVVSSRLGKPDVEVKLEVEAGKKTPAKLKRTAEDILRASKKQSVLDIVKILKQFKKAK